MARILQTVSLLEFSAHADPILIVMGVKVVSEQRKRRRRLPFVFNQNQSLLERRSTKRDQKRFSPKIIRKDSPKKSRKAPLSLGCVTG